MLCAVARSAFSRARITDFHRRGRRPLHLTWTPHSRRADTIVDADATARRAIGLGALVTVARFDGGVHDLTLSAPPVREQVFAALRRWLGGYVLR